jgi:hypothetical protein
MRPPDRRRPRLGWLAALRPSPPRPSPPLPPLPSRPRPRAARQVATLLHDAHKNASAEAEDGDETVPADIGPGHKFADVKLTRSLCADITKYGARLHELLGQHAEAKEGAIRA